MAELGTIELLLASDEPTCPVCGVNIPVVCEVGLSAGTAEKVIGSFGQPSISVEVQYDIVSVTINHSCEVKANG